MCCTCVIVLCIYKNLGCINDRKYDFLKIQLISHNMITSNFIHFPENIIISFFSLGKSCREVYDFCLQWSVNSIEADSTAWLLWMGPWHPQIPVSLWFIDLESFGYIPWSRKTWSCDSDILIFWGTCVLICILVVPVYHHTKQCVRVLWPHDQQDQLYLRSSWQPFWQRWCRVSV